MKKETENIESKIKVLIDQKNKIETRICNLQREAESLQRDEDLKTIHDLAKKHNIITYLENNFYRENNSIVTIQFNINTDSTNSTTTFIPKN